jgi:CRISPR/Cas system endoribonuclease Cas6 (RAMP superfamily)
MNEIISYGLKKKKRSCGKKKLNELEHLIELEELVEMKVTWFYNFFLLLSQSDKPHATANKKLWCNFYICSGTAKY